jgi:hypothetical protein
VYIYVQVQCKSGKILIKFEVLLNTRTYRIEALYQCSELTPVDALSVEFHLNAWYYPNKTVNLSNIAVVPYPLCFDLSIRQHASCQ